MPELFPASSAADWATFGGRWCCRSGPPTCSNRGEGGRRKREKQKRTRDYLRRADAVNTCTCIYVSWRLWVQSLEISRLLRMIFSPRTNVSTGIYM